MDDYKWILMTQGVDAFMLSDVVLIDDGIICKLADPLAPNAACVMIDWVHYHMFETRTVTHNQWLKNDTNEISIKTMDSNGDLAHLVTPKSCRLTKAVWENSMMKLTIAMEGFCGWCYE